MWGKKNLIFTLFIGSAYFCETTKKTINNSIVPSKDSIDNEYSRHKGYNETLNTDIKNPFKKKNNTFQQSLGRKENDLISEANDRLIGFNKFLSEQILKFLDEVPEAQSNEMRSIVQDFESSISSGSGYKDVASIIKKIFDELRDLDRGNPKVMSKFTTALFEALKSDTPLEIAALEERKKNLLKLLNNKDQPAEPQKIIDEIKGIFTYGKSADNTKARNASGSVFNSINGNDVLSNTLKSAQDYVKGDKGIDKLLEEVAGSASAHSRDTNYAAGYIAQYLPTGTSKEKINSLGYDYVTKEIQNTSKTAEIYEKLSLPISEEFLVRHNKAVQYYIMMLVAKESIEKKKFVRIDDAVLWKDFDPDKTSTRPTADPIVANKKVAGGTFILGPVDHKIKIFKQDKDAKGTPSLMQLNYDIEVDGSNKPIRDYENCFSVYNALTIDLDSNGKMASERIKINMSVKKGDWTPLDSDKS